MPISEGLEEAYASVDNNGFIYDTVEIDHNALEEPLYFVRGTTKAGEFTTMQFPVLMQVGDPPVPTNVMKTFTMVDFGLQRPGQEEGGVTRARLRIDNVSRIIQSVMRDVIASDQPIRVTYRCYWSEDLENPEVYSGMKMNQVAITALSAEGELFYQEVDMQAFPRETYDLSRYPTLFYQ